MPATVPDLPAWELVVRVVLAAALGGVIGFEREFRDQPAGFRTHMLVALGAALFTIAGAYAVEGFLEGSGAADVRFDPTRVAAQVVTGIGFLGAGAILRQGMTVRGLTTAAALWVTAAVGVAVGLGYWLGAIVTAVLTVAALLGLKNLERVLFSRLRRGRHEFLVEMTPELRVGDLTSLIESHRSRVQTIRLEDDDTDRTRLCVTVLLPPHLTPGVLAEEIGGLEGVTDVEWS